MSTTIDDPSQPLRPRDGDEDAATADAKRRAAERACEDLLVQLEGAAKRAVAAPRPEWSAHEMVLVSLVERFAACARAAALGADVLLRQLQSALGGYADARPEHAADLLRTAILNFYELVS